MPNGQRGWQVLLTGTQAQQEWKHIKVHGLVREQWIVVLSSVQGTGKEAGSESHLVEDLQGDLKLLNEENAVLVPGQKWASTSGHQTPDAPRCLWTAFLMYISCGSGGLPYSPSIPFSQAEFSDPQAGPSFSDHFGLCLPICIKLPPTRLEAFSVQGTDLIWRFCPVSRVVPGIERMLRKCILNECLKNWMNALKYSVRLNLTCHI